MSNEFYEVNNVFVEPLKTKLVLCDYCFQWKPENDCEAFDERIGTDLMIQPVYLCDECAEELLYGYEQRLRF
jgi:hypothetical protein